MRKNRPDGAPVPRGVHLSRADLIRLCITVVAVSLSAALYQRLTGLPFFRVREVIVRQDGAVRSDAEKFAFVKGKNIFALDLARESRRIGSAFPSYEQVRLIKFYPDKLFVDFIKRSPLACINGNRAAYIDENLVVFRLPEQAEDPRVPLVTGIERLVKDTDYGQRLASVHAASALTVIREFKSVKALSDYTLTKVDVTVPGNLTIVLLVPVGHSRYPRAEVLEPESQIEVKIGSEDIRQKLGLLATLLAQVRTSLAAIEYIDVRFKEPVIKFRERT